MRKGVQKLVFFKHYFSELPYASSKKNDYQRDLFKTNLEGMLNHNEPLFRLAQKIDWKKFDTEFGKLYCPDNGRPAKSTRLMVGLHYLKATFNESDETVLDKWVQNVYWQYFCGCQEFQQEASCDHSTLSRWRKRIKSKGRDRKAFGRNNSLCSF